MCGIESEILNQKSLFEGPEVGGGGTLPAIGSGGKAAKLSKDQKRFNKLVADIGELRRTLARWHAFMPVYRRRVVEELEPLRLRLRERRVAMVNLLDRVVDGQGLTKRQREKVADILVRQLSDLLQAGEDAELVRLYDKYADTSYAEGRADEMNLAREMAASVFGVEIDDGFEADTPEDLIDHIAERLYVNQSEAPPDPGPARKKSAKTLAHEARLEAAARSASQSVREVFRKLASQLHPDREPDPVERERKNALMQRVNKAYADGDLLELLELQLSVEQIDAAALAGMAEERVRHYNQVLGEQLERLREELDEVTAPFMFGMPDKWHGDLAPESAGRRLDVDMHDMKLILRDLEADLEGYKDLRVLKASLAGYRLSDQFPGSDDFLDEIIRKASPPKRRKRR